MFTAGPPGAAPAGGSGDGRIVSSRPSPPPEAPPRPPDDGEEDEDHPRPRDDYDDGGPLARAGWARVRVGLTIFLIGVYVFLGSCFLGVLGILVAGVLGGAALLAMIAAVASNNPNAGAAGAGGGVAAVVAVVLAIVSYILLLLGSLVEWILQSIGQVFLLWIPNRPGTGRRPLAIVTVALWFAQLALTLFSWGSVALRVLFEMLGYPEAGMALGLGNNCLSLVHAACGFAWFFVFMFLLRAIALSCGREALARTILIFTITVPVFAVVSFLAFFGLLCGGALAMGGFGAAGVSPQTIGGLGIGWIVALVAFMLLFLVIYVGLWIWWVVILHRTRGAVTARLNEGD